MPRRRVVPAAAVVAFLLLIGAVPATGAEPSTAPAVERKAERVRTLLRRPADARLPAAISALERAVSRTSRLEPADRRRLRAAVRDARAARTHARRGQPRRARRLAARARSRLRGAVRRTPAPVPAPPPFAPRPIDVVAPPAPSPAPPPPAPEPSPEPTAEPTPEPTAEPTPEPSPEPRTSGYVPRDLPVGLGPHDRVEPIRLDDKRYRLDENGVRVVFREGVRYYHPAFGAWYALAMLDGHRTTGDPEYLRRARTNAASVLAPANSVRTDEGLWLTYPFDIESEDFFNYPGERMAAPWHSGLAQGLALNLTHEMAELARLDGDEAAEARYLRTADEVFSTAFAERRPGERWFAYTDDDGYLWFEEFPTDAEPPRVLNGHISATVGMWQHALVTGDPEARRLFDAGATTARHYARVLRRPGDISAYSVRTPWQVWSYQGLHIELIRELGRMTGDPEFEAIAQDYAWDLEQWEAEQDDAGDPGGR